MAKTTVEVVVDDLDGSEGAETVRLGWNGEWREIDLSKRNLSSLSKALNKFWDAGRPMSGEGQSRRRSRATTTRSRGATNSTRGRSTRDPKAIRAWATENGIAVPTRGRIPAVVEVQYNQSSGG